MMKRTILFAAIAVAMPVAGWSQQPEEEPKELDELTVTADFRESSVGEIPTSVTVIDEQTIRDAGETHFQDVLDLVPNLNWSAGSNRPRFFQIRGIGERSQYEGAPNPSVGFLIDDIDFSGIGTVATLFDTQQIEVLRGPQGTRYGANALAGLINVRTADPTPFHEQRLELIAGDDDTWSAGFASGGPLSENGDVQYRFSIHQYEADGFRDNPFLDRDDTNGRDEFTSRLKLRWLPNDDWQVDFTGFWADLDNGYDAFVPNNELITFTDDPGFDAQESLGLALKANYTGWENTELLSTTTFANSDILYSFDGDWGNDELYAFFGQYDFTSETDRERQTFSQELRWRSKEGSEIFNGSTSWVAGLYVLDLEEENSFLDFFNDEVFRDLDSDYEATNMAAFGQLDIQTSERDTLSVGLRFERRDAEYRDTNGLDLNPTDNAVGGQISFSRELDRDKTAYVLLSRGYKAGGFNLGLSVPESRREYDPEYLWNLEAGVKGQFGNNLSANLSVFYAERDELQVGTSFQVDPTDPLTFVFFTDNAAGGTNYGVELDWTYRANDSFRLFGSLGLLDTEFNNLETPERRLDGREQAHAPNYQFNLGAEYRALNGWFGRVDINGKDEFFFSDSHDEISEAYELVNVRVGYEQSNWGVYAFARNVFDEEYATRGFFFGLEPPNFEDTRYIQRGDPRHFGVNAFWRF